LLSRKPGETICGPPEGEADWRVERAIAAEDPSCESLAVEVQLDEAGAKRLARLTRDNKNRRSAILVDDCVLGTPVIKSTVTRGMIAINGRFTPTEASLLAEYLNPQPPEQPRPSPGTKDENRGTTIEERFAYVLKFDKLGKTGFAEGDRITITEIRGTRRRFEVGGTYLVRGTYTLGSRDRALLAVYTTVAATSPGDEFTFRNRALRAAAAQDAALDVLRHPGAATSPDGTKHSMNVEKGSGEFALEKTLEEAGNLHVSFYADGGSFGEVYFGQYEKGTHPTTDPKPQAVPPSRQEEKKP
jgi:hypothetical protein